MALRSRIFRNAKEPEAVAKAKRLAARIFASIENEAYLASQDHPVVKFLQSMVLGTALAAPDDWRERRAYLSPEHWVLAHGRPFKWRPLPRPWRRGTIRQCYANTLAAASGPKAITYVEGYCAAAALPVLHAWGLDKSGGVLELTLRPEFTLQTPTYFGVPIRTDFVEEMHEKSGRYGVIDAWEIGYPLLVDESLSERAVLKDD